MELSVLWLPTQHLILLQFQSKYNKRVVTVTMNSIILLQQLKSGTFHLVPPKWTMLSLNNQSYPNLKDNALPFPKCTTLENSETDAIQPVVLSKCSYKPSPCLEAGHRVKWTTNTRGPPRAKLEPKALNVCQVLRPLGHHGPNPHSCVIKWVNHSATTQKRST